jgi:hypothetical protein
VSRWPGPMTTPAAEKSSSGNFQLFSKTLELLLRLSILQEVPDQCFEIRAKRGQFVVHFQIVLEQGEVNLRLFFIEMVAGCLRIRREFFQLRIDALDCRLPPGRTPLRAPSSF